MSAETSSDVFQNMLNMLNMLLFLLLTLFVVLKAIFDHSSLSAKRYLNRKLKPKLKEG